MTSTTATQFGVSHTQLELVARRTLARRPELWVYALARGRRCSAARETMSIGLALTALPPDGGSWPGAWSGWMLMVVAMMLAVLAPHARQVAMRSLWRRRHRAMIGYLSGYLTVWAVVGVPIVGALYGAHQPHPGAGVTAAALFGAGVGMSARARRRVMRRCGAFQIGAVRGAAADRDCAVAGWRAGWLCALTCGPVILAMGVGHHYPMLMAGLLALLLTERARGPNPARRAGRPLEAWCLVGSAALLAVVAFS